MTQPEGIIVTATNSPEELAVLEKLAAERNVEVGHLDDPNTWVFVARDSQEHVVGGVAVHLSEYDEMLAEFQFDLVEEAQRGRGIGNFLLQRCVSTLDTLVGRHVIVDSQVVAANQDDFEDRTLEPQANSDQVLVLR